VALERAGGRDTSGPPGLAADPTWQIKGTGDLVVPPNTRASLVLDHGRTHIDDAEDDQLDSRWDKMVRRSYSISSPRASWCSRSAACRSSV